MVSIHAIFGVNVLSFSVSHPSLLQLHVLSSVTLCCCYTVASLVQLRSIRFLGYVLFVCCCVMSTTLTDSCSLCRLRSTFYIYHVDVQYVTDKTSSSLQFRDSTPVFFDVAENLDTVCLVLSFFASVANLQEKILFVNFIIYTFSIGIPITRCCYCIDLTMHLI